jgi:hypothetical protein
MSSLQNSIGIWEGIASVRPLCACAMRRAGGGGALHERPPHVGDAVERRHPLGAPAHARLLSRGGFGSLGGRRRDVPSTSGRMTAR